MFPKVGAKHRLPLFPPSQRHCTPSAPAPLIFTPMPPPKAEKVSHTLFAGATAGAIEAYVWFNYQHSQVQKAKHTPAGLQIHDISYRIRENTVSVRWQSQLPHCLIARDHEVLTFCASSGRAQLRLLKKLYAPRELLGYMLDVLRL